MDSEDYDKFFNHSILSDSDLNNFIESDNREGVVLKAISGILLFVMIVIGLFGNILLIHIIAFKWKIQTAFNLFLINIAIADILFTTTLSLFLTQLFLDEFIFGSKACKVVAFFVHFSPLLSILTIITALIVLEFNVGILKSTIVITSLYIGSLFPAFFQATSYNIIDAHLNNDKEINICVQFESTQVAKELLKDIDIFIQFKIPFAVLIIYFILWLTQKMVTGVKILNGHVYHKLLIIIAVIYILCWTPFLYDFHNLEAFHGKYVLVLMHFLNYLCIISVICKPFLYMYMHTGLRKEFLKFLKVGSS